MKIAWWLGQRTVPGFRIPRVSRLPRVCRILLLSLVLTPDLLGQTWSLSKNPQLQNYFEHIVSQIEVNNELTSYETLNDWQLDRPQLRKQLFDMLGLNPLPEKTPLHSEVTGTVEHPEFTVERLHFQSMPGLYVTGNLYLPRPAKNETSETKTYPTILYVCGHAQVKKDGVSYGNKTYYQHHGAWFARNGYACLIIDTIQRGEIEGVHHGTYRLHRWWWNSRGYTPAGSETWNCIRALDYLATRKECDMTRVGVTGRSGGGIYSWWLAALDDRVQCIVPVAGITSMRDQVLNGCIEGHCDCMFMLNLYQWNFAKIAALVAPRPLLISNTDKDPIFPLEGVLDVHRQVRHIFRLYDAHGKLGLQITEGPHADTQELHIHAFRWFNRFLKSDQSMIEKTAEKMFPPEMLKVFDALPADEVNNRIDELFVAAAAPLAAESILEKQATLLGDYQSLLLQRCFACWPNESDEARVAEVEVESIELANQNDKPANSSRLSMVKFTSEPFVSLRLDVNHSIALRQIESINLRVDKGLSPFATSYSSDRTAKARLTIRPGTEPWVGDERKQTHIRRRFQILGMTLEGQQVWDIRRGLQVLRQQCPHLKKITLTAGPGTESLVLLASLFEPAVDRIVVHSLPTSNRELPSILNLTRTMTVELLPILAALRSEVITADAFQQHRLFHDVVSNSSWNGRKVQFAAKSGQEISGGHPLKAEAVNP